MVIFASCNRASLWAYARQPLPRMLPGYGNSPEPVAEEMPSLVLNSPRRALQCRSWRWSILSFCKSKDLCFDHHPAELLGELRNFRAGHAESRAPEQLRDRVIPRHRVPRGSARKFENFLQLQGLRDGFRRHYLVKEGVRGEGGGAWREWRAVGDPTHETENPPPRPPKIGLPARDIGRVDRAHGTHQKGIAKSVVLPQKCVGVPSYHSTSLALLRT